MKKRAFTLAETLITIGIIGIVAALTIPQLVGKYRRLVLETQFKKAYSQMQQAVKLWQEADTDDLYGTYYDYRDGNGVAMRESFYKHLKGFTTYKKTAEIKPYYTSAKNSTTTIHYCPASCCGNPGYTSFTTTDGIMYNICARDNVINIAFDINGYDKGPNKWGIDYFDFEINSENKITGPAYTSTSHCSAYRHVTTTNVNDGISCSNFALKDSKYFWEIDL